MIWFAKHKVYLAGRDSLLFLGDNYYRTGCFKSNLQIENIKTGGLGSHQGWKTPGHYTYSSLCR